MKYILAFSLLLGIAISANAQLVSLKEKVSLDNSPHSITASASNVKAVNGGDTAKTSRMGSPGRSVSIRVRCCATNSQGNEPLYVVDGTPKSYKELSEMGLIARDIESITVLKEAEATTMYGCWAGNKGVVLITTTKAKVPGAIKEAGAPALNPAGFKAGIYPNPAKGSLYTNLSQPGNLKLYNLQGNEVFNKDYQQGLAMDISLVTPGIYTYSIVSAAGNYTGRVVVE